MTNSGGQKQAKLPGTCRTEAHVYNYFYVIYTCTCNCICTLNQIVYVFIMQCYDIIKILDFIDREKIDS